jgi:erythromycin esterase
MRRIWGMGVACVVGASGCGESTSTDVDPPPQTPAQPDRLLTDEELRTPQATVEVPIDSAWAAWTVANHHPVRSLRVDDDFSDLAFLEDYIGDRRFVQLGESGHGVSEFSSAKVRLIKYLHEHMGFDVIAFESSIWECHMANEAARDLTAMALMQSCIFPVWHAGEVVELFEYIKATHATSRPLTLAGFDSQISSRVGSQERPTFFRDVVATFNPTYADSVAVFDHAFVRLLDRSGAGSFAEVYDALLDSIDTHRSTIDAAFPAEPWRGLLARQTAWSMTQFIAQISGSQGNPFLVRDRAMAANLTVLADSLYPAAKIVTWAHNSHIGESRAAMGRWVSEEHGDEVYTVGLYMHEGRAAFNDRRVYDIPEPSVAGLEAVLYRPRVKYLFVDFRSQVDEPGTSWMFGTFPTRAWGLNTELIVPRAEYDGVLFIHTVNPPGYL